MTCDCSPVNDLIYYPVWVTADGVYRVGAYGMVVCCHHCDRVLAGGEWGAL